MAGNKQLSKFKDLKLVKIYLILTNKEELKKRLLKEIKIPKKIEKRFNSFDEDVKHWNDYDYILLIKILKYVLSK